MTWGREGCRVGGCPRAERLQPLPGLTVIVGLAGVLDLQHPVPHGVLVPRVGRHESPVVEAVGRVVVRSDPGGEEKSGTGQGGLPGATTSGVGWEQAYLAASSVERVPWGLTRWMARSPRRL